MTAAQYAKALFELGGDADAKKVREALTRRGHQRLMPRILAEYEKLAHAQKRLALHKKVTPEKERTRVLLELYRTLVQSA